MLCVSLKHGLSANKSSYLFRRGLREFGRKRNFFVIFVGQKRHSLLSLKNKVQISNPSCTRIRRWRFKKYRLINMGIEIYKGKICTRTKYPHLNSASWESEVFPRFWMLIAEGNRRDTFFSRCLFADVISVHSRSMKRARARVIPWISKRRYIYIYIYKQIYLDPVLFCYQTAFCTTSQVEHAFLFVSLLYTNPLLETNIEALLMWIRTCSLSSFTNLSFSALNFRTSASLPAVGDNSSSAMLASFSEMVASKAFCLQKRFKQRSVSHYKCTW